MRQLSPYEPRACWTVVIDLLRHAMAELSEHTGSEPMLTGAGRERAEQLAIRLRGSDIRRFLSSPACRCLETLTPLVEVMPGAEIDFDPHRLEGARLSGCRRESGSFR